MFPIFQQVADSHNKQNTHSLAWDTLDSEFQQAIHNNQFERFQTLLQQSGDKQLTLTLSAAVLTDDPKYLSELLKSDNLSIISKKFALQLAVIHGKEGHLTLLLSYYSPTEEYSQSLFLEAYKNKQFDCLTRLLKTPIKINVDTLVQIVSDAFQHNDWAIIHCFSEQLKDIPYLTAVLERFVMQQITHAPTHQTLNSLRTTWNSLLTRETLAIEDFKTYLQTLEDNLQSLCQPQPTSVFSWFKRKRRPTQEQHNPLNQILYATRALRDALCNATSEIDDNILINSDMTISPNRCST